ncbi:CMRF35-like molecule 5 [Astyanax mexicanus]|uniref:CMRF35-like molecule 5 n=1 Tax=Astyanax mexicanus TaxID=7994 RepID=A0A8T2LIU2_ASTMX|nr:CMRF35-like molecule 5 [Astyanax mexicanus]
MRRMETLVRILALLQVLMGLAAQKKTVAVFTGTEGGSVEINCRYKDSYIYSNHYFCHDPCRYFDVLIETSKADIPVSKDRYSILNTVSARSVSVTIKNLSLTDSGVYYCGVDQWGSDILTEVQISVKKDPFHFHTSTRPPASTKQIRTTSSTSDPRTSETSSLFCVRV